VATTSTAPVSAADYLSRTYHPDREFLEGTLLERNVGEISHGDAQGSVYFFVRTNCPEFWAGVEIRVQVRPERFRVPDVAIVREGKPEGRIITSPPEIAVEVMSPEDRPGDLEDKIADYLAFGVDSVWVIDPETRRARIHTRGNVVDVANEGALVNAAGDLAVPLTAIFG
jgi:Uma2 family endonuclease